MTSGRKGFRQKAVGSKSDAIRELQTTVSNLQQAVRISQMMQQHLVQNFQRMDEDMGKTMTLLNETQYRSLAMLKSGSFDLDKIDQLAEELKLKDYNDASDKEDKEKNYTTIDTVTKDDIAIITSSTESGEGEIFRSKFKLGQAGLPELVEKLDGKKVGETVEVTIAGTVHKVTLVGARREPPKAEQTETSEQVQQVQ